MRLLPSPRTTPTAAAAQATPPPPGPAPVLCTACRRAFSPAARAGTPQARAFHTAYAVVILPLVLTLHALLWALSSPGRLCATVLVLYALGHAEVIAHVSTR